MRWATVTLCGALVLTSSSGQVRAEEGEWGVVASGSLVAPGFTSLAATDFALVTWAAGLGAEYGLHSDVWLEGFGTFSRFSGEVDETRTFFGEPLSGRLQFVSSQVHLQVGLRWNLLPGFPVSPYVVGRTGFLFSAFDQLRFTNATGETFGGVPTPAETYGQWTVSGGLLVDVRVVEFLLVGVGVVGSTTLTEGRSQLSFEVPLRITLLLGDV